MNTHGSYIGFGELPDKDELFEALINDPPEIRWRVVRTLLRIEDPQHLAAVQGHFINRLKAIESPPERWNGSLGAGYQVLARFIVWQGEDVLQIPSAALFRVGEAWSTFVVESGRAVRRTVSIGQQAGLDTQVLDGLQEGDEVIVHPGNTIEEGVAVRAGLGSGGER